MESSSATVEHPGELLGPAQGLLTFRVRSKEHRGRVLRIRSAKCQIGSAANCTLRLRAAGVHPVHCVVMRGRQGTVIQRWSGKVCLNGVGIVESWLAPGDRIHIGPVELEYLEQGAAHRAPTLADEQEQVALRQTLDALRSELRDVKQQHAQQRSEQQSLVNFAALAEKQLQDVTAALQNMRQPEPTAPVDKQAGDAENAQQLLEQLQERDAQLASVQSTLQEQQQETRQWQQRANEMAAELTRLQSELGAAQDRYELTRGDLESLRESRDQSLQEQGGTQQELQQLRQDLQEAREELGQAREQLDTARRQQDVTQHELSSVRSELLAAQQEFARLQTQQQEEHRELEQLRAQLAHQDVESESDRAEQQDQLTRLKSQLDDAAHKLLAAEDWAGQLQTQLDKAQRQLHEGCANDSQAEVVQESARCRELVDIARIELRQEREEHQRVRNEWHTERESLQKQLAEHSQALDKLQAVHDEKMEEAEYLIRSLQCEGKQLLSDLDEAKEELRRDTHHRPDRASVHQPAPEPDPHPSTPCPTMVMDTPDQLRDDETVAADDNAPSDASVSPEAPVSATMVLDAHELQEEAATRADEMVGCSVPQPPVEPHVDSDDDEGMIQQYMERLLKRVAKGGREGDDEGSTAPEPQAAAPTPISRNEVTEAAADVQDAKPVALEAGEDTPSAQAEGAEGEPAAVESNLADNKPTRPRPVKQEDFSAMRELANHSARSAIKSFDVRRFATIAVGELFVAAICVVAGFLIIVMSEAGMVAAKVGGAIGMAFGAILFLRACRKLLGCLQLRSSNHGELDKEAAVEAEILEPSEVVPEGDTQQLDGEILSEPAGVEEDELEHSDLFETSDDEVLDSSDEASEDSAKQPAGINR